MITFAFDGKEYQVRNPILSNILEVNQKALFGRSASGVLYRYNKGVTHKRLEMKWEELTEDEKTELLNAFVAIKTSQFSMTDHTGQTWLAILLVDKLAFETISDEESGSVRNNARYNCSIEIEAVEA